MRLKNVQHHHVSSVLSWQSVIINFWIWPSLWYHEELLCLVLQNQLFWLFLLPICLKRFDGKIINHWSGPQRENDSRVRESITEWVSWTNTQTDFLIKWFIMNARGDQENLFINPLNCHKHRVTVAISIIYSIIFHSSDGQTMIQRQSHISTILLLIYRA